MTGDARAGVLKEASHPVSFFALCRNQLHVPPQVVVVLEGCERALVPGRIGFEPRDSLLDHGSEADADLEVLP